MGDMELKPCPFCGGDAKEFTGEDAAPHRWTVECDSCGAHVGSDTRYKARAKWNRRTRRTCRYVRDHMGVAGNWFCKCSECGAEFDERVVDRHFDFCPNCGSMVIGEETGDAD